MDASHLFPNPETVAAIEKDIETYNKRRRHALGQVRTRMPLLMGGLVAGSGIALVLLLANIRTMPDLNARVLFAVLVLGSIFGGVGLYQLARQPGEDAKQGFRSHVVPVLFGFVTKLRYSHGKETPTFARLPAPMKGNFNHREFGDIISGQLPGGRFEICELTLKRKSKSSEVTLFRGVVLRCKPGFTFPGTVIAVRRPRPGLFQAVDDLFRTIGEFFKGERLEKVLSRSHLDKSYDFLTDRPDEAEMLLRGRLRTVLEWINDKWPDGGSRIAMRDGEIFVMLPSEKDFFELPDIDVPVVYGADLEPMVTEFAQILAIVEEVQRTAPSESNAAAGASPIARDSPADEASMDTDAGDAEVVLVEVAPDFVPLLDPVEPSKPD